MKFNEAKIFITFYALIVAVSGLTGCYPVHSIEKYPSKTEYYKKANSAFEGKTVEVSLLRSDSTFYAQDATIRNDSISLSPLKEWEQKTLHMKDVVITSNYYKDHDNLCARLKLSNGEIINGEFVIIHSDSTIDFKVLNSKTITLPLNEIKAIHYGNYRGIPTGFLLGVVGGITGGLIIKNAVKQDPHPGPNQQGSSLPHDDGMGAFVVSAVAGPIIGTTVGWFVGGRTTWEFNK